MKIMSHTADPEKEPAAMQCRQCGACCHVDMFAYITDDDIRRWEQENRFDIINHIRGTEVKWFGDIILSGQGIHIQSCTFLNWDGNAFCCDIYDTRPHVCRNYVPGSSALCPLYQDHT